MPKKVYMGATGTNLPHIADPTANAAVALTDASGGTPDVSGDIEEVTEASAAGSADTGPVANNIATLAAEVNELRTAVNNNQTAINAMLAQLASAGIHAAS